MVKIERKDTALSRIAIDILEKERKKNGKFDKQEVNDALEEIFHGKCYICENKKSVEYEIDHFKPKKYADDLKFDWNNLFWSCSHCNNTKRDKFYPILDCTEVDIDDYIAFRKIGYFGVPEKFEFEIIKDSVATKNTCDLLNAVHYGTAAKKKIGSSIIRRELRQELSNFKEYIREYQESKGENKKDLSVTIKLELKSNSAFTAFKRWIVRDNPKICADFIDCWKSR